MTTRGPPPPKAGVLPAGGLLAAPARSVAAADASTRTFTTAIHETDAKCAFPPGFCWPPGLYVTAMPVCPICRRSYDGRFQVFVPSHYEAFDTVACARRAAEVGGWEEASPIPIVLPTIEVVSTRSETQLASAATRLKVAALGALVVAPGQAALATGVGLLAAGTAASIYLLAQPPGTTTHSAAVAVGAPHAPQTPGPAPAATRPPARHPGPAAIRPSEVRPATAATRPSATGSAGIRPAPKTTKKAVQPVSNSAAQAQYGTYHPPFSSRSASLSAARRTP
jgi:hypothetical protein